MSSQKRALQKKRDQKAKALKRLTATGLSVRRAKAMVKVAGPALAVKAVAWMNRARKAIRAEVWKAGRKTAVHSFVEISLLLFIDQAMGVANDQAWMQKLYQSEGVPPLPTKDGHDLYKMLRAAEIALS